jgi:hypothetical protein
MPILFLKEMSQQMPVSRSRNLTTGTLLYHAVEDQKTNTVRYRYIVSKDSALISAPLGVLQRALHMVIQSSISFPETVQDPAFLSNLIAVYRNQQRMIEFTHIRNFTSVGNRMQKNLNPHKKTFPMGKPKKVVGF